MTKETIPTFCKPSSEFCNQDPDFSTPHSFPHNNIIPLFSSQIVKTYETPKTMLFPLDIGAFGVSALNQIVQNWQPTEHHINPSVDLLTNQPSKMETKCSRELAGIIALATNMDKLPHINSNWGNKKIAEGVHNF